MSRSDQENNGKTKGWADVAIRLIDALYNLARTGNLIGLLIFGFLCWGFLITVKLPEDSISPLLKILGNFLISEKFYLFPLGATLTVSVITNILQARIYKAHIHDLTEHRKILVHGLQNGTMQPLKNHMSSGFDVKSNTTKTGNGEDNAIC